MQNPRAKGLSRFISAVLVLAMVLAVVPPFELPVFAAGGQTHTFDADDGAVYIDSSFNGDTVYILDGVFSVTVNGAQNVNLIFGERTATGANGVTIDRRHATNPVDDQDKMNGKTIKNLYYVSQQLGAQGRAQTCPLLITGNSTVSATFHGSCRFYAGTNACSVSASNVYTARTGGDNSNRGNGFAGIQVDSGSSLTIEGADDLMVFGGHQFGIPDIDTDDDGKADSLKYGTSNTSTQVKYSDLLRANASIGTHTNPSSISQYGAPPHAVHLEYSGGAGIGGGPGLTPGTSQDADFNGAAGTIIINGGNIEAFGGQQAAGIGGAVNSPATTSIIQINGGNVIAHGGRWAAGIGDGDTVTNPNTANIFETANSIIEINGGTVEAYGGVASSGIGTSDEMTDNKGFGSDFVRSLQINLNGGVIRAYSGFPDNFNGNSYPAEAPAAIGAGSKTLTYANSVYVSSDANLRSGGFGNYALTENGLNSSTVPTIAVDSDGYLLLLQTASYHSTAERSLKIYLPLTHTMMVDTNGDNVLDTEMETYIFTNQKIADSRYYVALVKDSEGVEYKMVFDSEGHRVNNAENLTLYVDPAQSTELVDLRIEFPYYFRSIALTLPHPELYGGIYALAVPVDGVSNSIDKPANDADIILTIDAREQGTQNGTITFPSENNLQSRPVSAPFIDLDVFGSDKLTGLIGNSFYPTVYGYTVYAEPGETAVDLYMEWASRSNTTYQLSFNNGEQTKNVSGDGGMQSWTIENIPLTGSETILRIQKKDVNSDNPDPISYKITIIRKDDLSLLVNSPGKVYDGQPANASATAVVQYPTTYSVKDFKTADAYTETITMKEVTEYFSGSVYLNRSGYGSNYTYYAASLSYNLHIIPSGNDIYYILTVESRGSANAQSLTIPNPTTKYATGWVISKNGGGSYGNVKGLDDKPAAFTGTGYTWIDSNVSGNGNYGSATLATANVNSFMGGSSTTSLYLRVNGSGAYLQVGSGNNQTILTIGAPATRNTSTGTSRDNAEDAADAALKDGATHGTFPYNRKTVSGTNQIITMGVPAWDTDTQITEYSKPEIVYPISGTTTYENQGYFSIMGTPDTSKAPTPVDVPVEDLEKVVYIYYRADTDEVVSLDKGPIDAGDYEVEARLTTQTYNAKSVRVAFTITRRPIKVLRIENWLLYVDTAPAGDTLAITTPGYIELDNVIPNDKGKVTLNPGTVYYDDKDSNTLAVDYKSDKIVIANGVLEGDEAHNYYLDYADPTHIRVYGQIAYKVSGAIFRKDNDTNWRKYYPVTSTDPVGAGTPVDYHSPLLGGSTVYLTHAEYIRARTVNQGSDESRYCIDIEYGAMNFGFYRSVWDVNGLDYHDDNGSYWTGMDGNNNKLTVINRSNRPISYTITLERAAGVNGSRLGFELKTTNVETGGTVLVDLTDDSKNQASGLPKVVNAATAGANLGDIGTAATDSCYLIMSKVPQFAEGVLTTTGTISITFAPVS